MSRRSPFIIVLSREERSTLEQRAAKYTSSSRDVVRAKIILLAAAGLRNDIIASRLSLQRQIVSKWRTRFFDQRLAGESPRTTGIPLARWSLRELQREVVTRGLVATISARPYGGGWPPMRSGRGVIAVGCSRAIPTLRRKPAPSWICMPASGTANRWPRMTPSYRPTKKRAFRPAGVAMRRGRPDPITWRKSNTSYERMGAWAYRAAWDVQRAKLCGRCEPGTGIAPFDRLVAQVMAPEPYCSARRVFWIFDNGSAHRGPKAVERLQRQWPNVIPIFTPLHASWLNQIEIDFSIVQRKVLTPGDFADLAALEAALIGFQGRYEPAARPFEWTFTRADLAALLSKLALADQRPAA